MHFVVLLSALVACAAGVPLTSTKPTPQGRILDGTLATIIEIPYQVSLRYRGQHKCGAVIIGENRALTAGHCIENAKTRGEDTREFYVVAGSSLLDSGGSRHNVSDFLTHEKYKVTIVTKDGKNSTSADYDIAILWVDPPFSFIKSVKDIEPAHEKSTVGSPVVVSGWGRYSDATNDTSNQLRKSTGVIVSTEECQDWRLNKLTARMLCFRDVNYTTGGPCKGDSGGPVVDALTGNLVGIVSSGSMCINVRRVHTATNIFKLHRWIEQHSQPGAAKGCLLL